MSQAQPRHTNNTVIGAGECFIDVLAANGKTQGERYLGDTPSGVLRVETEETTVVSGDGPTPRTLARVVSNIARSFVVTLQDISPENLALFVLGENVEQVDKATAVSRSEETTMTVKQGHWYQLGTRIDKPAGVGSVTATSCSVHNEVADGTPYTASTIVDGRVTEVGDYTLDADAGRLYIEPGENINDDDEICVAYTPKAQTLKTVVASRRKQIKAAFRYLEAGAQGRGNNYYAPLTLIRPEGDMALKGRTAAQSLTLHIEVLQPAYGAVASLYINQQPVSA